MSEKPWVNYHAFATLEARWRDLDAYNHVNNSVYFNYFEQARMALFTKNKALMKTFKDPDFGTTLVRTSAEYKAEVKLGDVLISAIKITSINKMILETEYAVFHKKTGKLATLGKATNLFVSKSNFKPKSLPKEILLEIKSLLN